MYSGGNNFSRLFRSVIRLTTVPLLLPGIAAHSSFRHLSGEPKKLVQCIILAPVQPTTARMALLYRMHAEAQKSKTAGSESALCACRSNAEN
jgi:hypothetical protein